METNTNPNRQTSRVGNLGYPIKLRDAVILGVKNGWSSKETAFETGWRHGSIQEYATRMQLSFVYCGMGPKPRFADKSLDNLNPNIKLIYKHPPQANKKPKKK